MTDTPVIDFEYSAQYRVTNPKPLVTALINNYNYGRFLAEAIDSALAQTWKNLEVLVVDDGSTDNSREVLEGYGDKIRVIYKENGGQASAFNTGIREAKGEIICFLDSDDCWYSEKVEKVVEKYQEAPWGLVCHDMHEVDVYGKRINDNLQSETNNSPLISGDLLNTIVNEGFKWMFSATSGMCLPTKLAKEILILPEENWRISADCPLAHASLCHAPVGAIYQALSAYRLHTSNGYANIKKDPINQQIQWILDTTNLYLFLESYLNNKHINCALKDIRKDYTYFRLICFAIKDKPYLSIHKLWMLNFKRLTKHNNHEKSIFFISKYFILDAILSVLFLFKIQTHYHSIRIRFKEKLSNTPDNVKNFILNI